MAERWSGVERVAAAELDICRVGVRSNSPGVVANHRPSLVHFLGEDTIQWMEEFGVATGEDPIDLEVLDPRLEFRAELGAQGQALFLASEIHDVFAGRHHCGSTCGEFEGLLALAGPGDGVLFFRFSGIKQAAGAADVLGELTG